MFCIQYMDYEEGSVGVWNELSNTRHETREAAREHLKRIRATEDEECLYVYRVTEVGSDLYYSQLTDKGEY
jgi:hypothetical protein